MHTKAILIVIGVLLVICIAGIAMVLVSFNNSALAISRQTSGTDNGPAQVQAGNSSCCNQGNTSKSPPTQIYGTASGGKSCCGQ